MLRLQTSTGWWLITHPEHARLAGQFAAHWGNALFAAPEPRAHVLHAIDAHDDGWAARDEAPQITAQGKPAAFSTELVGKYSAFEEIDLQAYLAVRRNAVQLIAQQDPYAAILISMHTHNLLSERADRSTIRAEHLPWLDAFLVAQMTLQRALREQLLAEAALSAEALAHATLEQHFQLLQACDNLSLLSCTDFAGDATLLHPFALRDGRLTEVNVRHIAARTFRLMPYPFDEPRLTFPTSEDLQRLFQAAPLKQLDVTVTA